MADTTLRRTDLDDATVAAVGKFREAYEWIERARGRLYDFHHLVGRADFLFEEAADLLDEAGHHAHATALRRDVVGRNVLDGRWTFQVVEEFDDGYFAEVRRAETSIREHLAAGVRHEFEARLKDQRRSTGRPGHEPGRSSRPPVITTA
jgi:hypothetical protein